jgi:hypothetical protein
MISLTRLTNEVDSSIEWLKRRLSEYRLTENDMGDIVEDFDEVGKLGLGFSVVDESMKWTLGMGKFTNQHTLASTSP